MRELIIIICYLGMVSCILFMSPNPYAMVIKEEKRKEKKERKKALKMVHRQTFKKGPTSSLNNNK